MKSPFPGMDPYLEAHWGDVHTSLITYARDQLHEQLPRDLRVRVEEHVTVHLSGEDGYGFYPDIRVVERPAHQQLETTSPESSGVALSDPLVVALSIEPQTERSLRIIDTRSGSAVVTAIEILSLSNKVGQAGQTSCLKKQRDLLAGFVNLVEIDLLRDGAYVPAAPPYSIPDPY